jgi:hypothetical protein
MEWVGAFLPPPRQRPDRRGRPASPQASLFRGYLVDSPNRGGMAISARRVSFALHLLAASQAVGRRRRVAECVARIAGRVGPRGTVEVGEAFLDGSFAPAKKGARPSEKPSGARARSGWYWSTVKVFGWEFGWKVPPPVKLSLRKPRWPKSVSRERKAARDKNRNG